MVGVSVNRKTKTYFIFEILWNYGNNGNGGTENEINVSELSHLCCFVGFPHQMLMVPQFGSSHLVLFHLRYCPVPSCYWLIPLDYSFLTSGGVFLGKLLFCSSICTIYIGILHRNNRYDTLFDVYLGVLYV